MRAPNYVHMNANGVQEVNGPLPLGIVAINTKGAGSNTLTLEEKHADGTSSTIAVIDTTVGIGSIDYGQLMLDGLRATLATGTAADVTISWG